MFYVRSCFVLLMQVKGKISLATHNNNPSSDTSIIAHFLFLPSVWILKSPTKVSYPSLILWTGSLLMLNLACPLCCTAFHWYQCWKHCWQFSRYYYSEYGHWTRYTCLAFEHIGNDVPCLRTSRRWWLYFIWFSCDSGEIWQQAPLKMSQSEYSHKFHLIARDVPDRCLQ